MPDEEEQLQSCSECGATIYPEHLENGLAEEVDGELLCRHCVDARQAADNAEPEPIALIEADEVEPVLRDERDSTSIRQFGAGPGGMGESAAGLAMHALARPLLKGSQNATRCRTFHAKLTDAAMVHLNDQVNEWVDQDENIEIKFATSAIGTIEGKHTDPHLIVTLFY